MIKSFNHKGLKLFFLTGKTSGIIPEHAKALQLRLADLHTATDVNDLANIPGYRLHRLKGDRQDIWSITVRANWRITFRFENGNAEIVNYEDYH